MENKKLFLGLFVICAAAGLLISLLLYFLVDGSEPFMQTFKTVMAISGGCYVFMVILFLMADYMVD